MEALIAHVERQVPEVTREQAIDALKSNDNDVVKAICELMARNETPAPGTNPTSSAAAAAASTATEPPSQQELERKEIQAHWKKVREMYDYMYDTIYEAVERR